MSIFFENAKPNLHRAMSVPMALPLHCCNPGFFFQTALSASHRRDRVSPGDEIWPRHQERLYAIELAAGREHNEFSGNNLKI